MLGELRTIRTARTQSGAQDTIPTSRRSVPFLAVIPQFVMGPGGISRFPPIGLPIATTERYVPAVCILLVPGAFAGVSGVVPSRRGRTGNRGGPSERGSSFSCLLSAEPSLVRESNRRTDRERALHGPWLSWSSRAISFPAPTSSKVDFSEAWQIPGFHNEVRALNLQASRRPKAVTRQEASRILRKLPAAQADLRADSAIRLRGNLSRHVVEQLVAESRRFVESAGRIHLRGHRELPRPDQDFDSDRVVLEGPAQPKALVRL